MIKAFFEIIGLHTLSVSNHDGPPLSNTSILGEPGGRRQPPTRRRLLTPQIGLYGRAAVGQRCRQLPLITLPPLVCRHRCARKVIHRRAQAQGLRGHGRPVGLWLFASHRDRDVDFLDLNCRRAGAAPECGNHANSQKFRSFEISLHRPPLKPVIDPGPRAGASVARHGGGRSQDYVGLGVVHGGAAGGGLARRDHFVRQSTTANEIRT